MLLDVYNLGRTMFKKLIGITLALSSFQVFAVNDLKAFNAPDDLSNIFVKKLSTDEKSTENIVFIKEGIAAHYHDTHTEMVYVIEGEAVMKMSGTTQLITPGNFIKIEPGVIHSVEVTSDIPLKVLTIHTPEFYGKDRVFVDDNKKAKR